MGREQIYCLDIFPDSDEDVVKIATIHGRLAGRSPKKSTPFFRYGPEGGRSASFLVGGEKAVLMKIVTKIFPGEIIEVDGLHPTGINIAGVMNEDLEEHILGDPRFLIQVKTRNGVGR